MKLFLKIGRVERRQYMVSLSVLHSANIITHVTAGSVALILGLVALLTRKGGILHRKSGRLFLLFLSVVIATGLIGVFVFGRNTFLLVITLLSGYLGYSGYRVLQAKSNQFNGSDVVVALVVLCADFYFLYYFKSIGMIWSPVIIYSTTGYLLFIITYD
ncbi:hypothetical protein FHW36_104178 [Chitinophaga polysaccharea]|uniref:Uncharacterized protein n=1 Tax=Chitinophaga polysaccharea TaxID=1293035 RepID=A0A561PQT7_9BACT|nr:hypothetical protein [Chitinophaga polysaccharea]TWF40496.1 hypothetical protein FHW36_104178 [Chitinophaga polysaccharea]